MELCKQVIFDKEAAVDELAKGCFWDKALINKRLFEIGKDERKSLKWGKKAPKSGGKKNFHFGNFGLSNLQKVGHLRMQDRQKKIDSG